MKPKGPSSKVAGLTLIEIVIIITVLGLLGLIATPVYLGVRTATLSSAAQKQAELIDNARDQYALTVPGSATAWAAAASDEDKLNLLIAQGLLQGPASSYLSMEGGYTVSLVGGVRGTTSVSSSNH